MLSTDQRVKLQLAELIVQNCDQARVIEELQAKLAELTPKPSEAPKSDG